MSRNLKDYTEAVCIFSGGIDSVSTASYLKKLGLDIYLISFNYGQIASIELSVAKKFSTLLKSKEHKIIDISFLKTLYGNTNVLTNSKSKIPDTFDYSIVVPLRNATFITIASVWAISLKVPLIVYGAHAGDKKYPDCRPSFVKSMESTLTLSEIDGIKLGLQKKINIWSPAMDNLDKTKLLLIGYDVLGDKLFQSWSCYRGNNANKRGKVPAHCGKCESCINRKKSITKSGLEDKTNYIAI
ncbi:MAG: 7-cyano-7-deazaguanine synthase [Candidatus Nitrosocosmicus sp.]